MSDVGEGSLLQKGPLPHAPSSLPPKTFDLIESLLPAFPASEKRPRPNVSVCAGCCLLESIKLSNIF